MRIAALFDVHGNLPALEAVLADVRRAGVDRVVVGGDVLPGAMPAEALDLLIGLDRPVAFIHGNGDLAVVAQRDAGDPAAVTYWGTASGAPLPQVFRPMMRWNAERLRDDHVAAIRGWPKTLRLDVDGVGSALFCHSTPRSETEIFTRATPEDRLRPIFDAAGAALVVCGHTHMPFDRTIGRTRVVNAGSVGMPYGESGAHWLLLGPGVERRRTPYDLDVACARIGATEYPRAKEDAALLLKPPSEAEMVALFEKSALR